MSSIQVRPFRRSDREQLTVLVNRHIQAVIPGMSVSANTVLNQLEREPGEPIVDPWVAERRTLVAVQHDRLVAAAHLLRYGDDKPVGEGYRGLGDIRWLVCWPPDFPWNDAEPAGDALVAACHQQFDAWRVGRRSADGALPAPGIYGVPVQWPHVREVENLADAGRVARHDGWADIGNCTFSPTTSGGGSRRGCSASSQTGSGWRTSTGCWSTPSPPPTPNSPCSVSSASSN